MEKFEIMQSIQNIADLNDDGFTFDSPKHIKEKLLMLNKELYHAGSIDSKFSATAYDEIDLKNKFMITDKVSGISSINHRKEIIKWVK